MVLPRRLIALLLGVVCVLGWASRPDAATPGRDQVQGPDDAAVVAGRVDLELDGPASADDDGPASVPVPLVVRRDDPRPASRLGTDVPPPRAVAGIAGRPRGPPTSV